MIILASIRDHRILMVLGLYGRPVAGYAVGMDDVHAVALARTLELLEPLKSWPPVARCAVRALEALRGGEGLDARDVIRMRRWAVRWSRLDGKMRQWYAARAAHEPKVGRALRWVLDHDEGARPPPGLARALYCSFRDYHGVPPWFDLMP
ncbi:MAG: hypothetical protein KGS10_16155 [Chloroflexi bacterium]|nr:hypothetical protein [Chloroflexota bacterium]